VAVTVAPLYVNCFDSGFVFGTKYRCLAFHLVFYRGLGCDDRVTDCLILQESVQISLKIGLLSKKKYNAKFGIIKPILFFKIWILIEDYMRINATFGFFESFSISSEIELRLGPSQIKIF
jgi:hypothetical protein